MHARRITDDVAFILSFLDKASCVEHSNDQMLARALGVSLKSANIVSDTDARDFHAGEAGATSLQEF
jgi:hypothetical protein